MAGIVAASILGGTALVGGIASSVLSSNAQEKSAKLAAQSQQQANQQNYQMFEEAHGSNGSAVLPQYLKNPDGSYFEGKLGSDLIGSYNNTSTPLSTFQAATAGLAPAQANANNLTNQVFNGGVTNGMLGNAAPVQAARMATARSSSMDALHKTLDEIDAQQASRGITGDSYGNRLLSFQAGKSAGDSIGAANLQNLQETADIKNYGNYTLPLQNMQLPYAMSQQAGNMAFLPQDQYLQSISQRMQPFNMLKIGYTGPFQYQPLPTPGPGAFSGAANALASLGGVASQAGGAAMQLYQQHQNQQFQQNMMSQLMASQNNGGAYGSPLLPSTAFTGTAPAMGSADATAAAGMGSLFGQ